MGGANQLVAVKVLGSIAPSVILVFVLNMPSHATIAPKFSARLRERLPLSVEEIIEDASLMMDAGIGAFRELSYQGKRAESHLSEQGGSTQRQER